MSIRLPPPPPPRYTVIERVAPRYDATYTVIYRTVARRLFSRGTRFILVSTDANSTITVGSQDLIPGATETLHVTIDSSLWKDKDDTTFAGYRVGAGATVDIATYDLGASMDLAVVIACSADYNNTVACRVLVSGDCTTFTQVLELPSRVAIQVGGTVTNAQCLRIQLYNYGASPSGGQIRSFEAYRLPPVRDVTIPAGTLEMISTVAKGVSQLLEVIEL